MEAIWTSVVAVVGTVSNARDQIAWEALDTGARRAIEAFVGQAAPLVR